MGHSTEQCLAVMIETWRKALDEKKFVGSLLTDFSKAFDCLNNNLLIAELAAYGFHTSALSFIYDYLQMRTQRTKVSDTYSLWRKLKYGVPQGSILGPLIFIIFLNDIVFFTKHIKIASYADDNTAYAVEDSYREYVKHIGKRV